MGAHEEKQGSHFLVDLTTRKVPLSAGTMSPRFTDSPRLRVPVHLKSGLHTLKHTLGQTERICGLIDRIRLQVFGVFVLIAVTGVTLWMVRDRQFLLGELVEAKEVQMSWEVSSRQPRLCKDVEEWKVRLQSCSGLPLSYIMETHFVHSVVVQYQPGFQIVNQLCFVPLTA
jgi:hypothetical protein